MPAIVNPKTLTADGDSLGWVPTDNFAELQYNVIISSGATVLFEGANDPALTTKSDAKTLATYTSSVSKVAFSTLPSFVRLRKSGATGTAIVSFGRAKLNNGESVAVSLQGARNQLSSELTPS